MSNQAIINANHAILYNRHCQAANTASLEGELLDRFNRTLPKLLGGALLTGRHLRHHRSFLPLERLPDNGQRPVHQPRPLLAFPVMAYQATDTEIEAGQWLQGHRATRPANIKANNASRAARKRALAIMAKSLNREAA